jgi:hypothetical protein
MNDTQLLERLTSAYATVAAPPPSAALAEILESGIGETDTDTDGEERRGAVVVPFVRPETRTGVRARHLVAACVATFVLFSGLAVAGALPGPVQRQVSSVVAHLGIDLPSPASGSAHDTPAKVDTPGSSDGHASTPTSSSTPTTAADGTTNTPVGAGGGVVSGVPSTTAPGSTGAGLGLGDIGVTGDPTTPTTLPPAGGSLLPPLTVPQVSLPPPLPQITLPPLTLPQLTLPQLPLPLPPLPILGL